VAGADIDAPWLFDSESFLRVHGVDVVPLVEAELNHRFPGRADRRAGDPDGLCAAWASLEHTWAATLERVAAMPAGTVEVSVGGDEMSIFTTVTPSCAEVLEVRAGRLAMVRDFLATVTSLELAATRRNPWDPEHQETTLSCLHVILAEEWEHHRYAVRDLGAIEAESDAEPVSDECQAGGPASTRRRTSRIPSAPAGTLHQLSTHQVPPACSQSAGLPSSWTNSPLLSPSTTTS